MDVLDLTGADRCHVYHIYKKMLINMVMGKVEKGIFPIFKVDAILVKVFDPMLLINIAVDFSRVKTVVFFRGDILVNKMVSLFYVLDMILWDGKEGLVFRREIRSRRKFGDRG